MCRNSDYPPELLSRLIGPIPPDDFASNGCTNSPDSIDGIDISAACHLHDWHYAVGGDEKRRFHADIWLRYNIHECISFAEFDDNDPTTPEIAGPSHLAAGIYYRRVRLWGVRFYNYYPNRTFAKKLWYMLRGSIRRWFE